MNTHNPRQDNHPRIGLFGGTFDPVHNGHRQVAVDILQMFRLDKVYFIPCALQPQKTNGPLASVENRIAMLNLAVADHPGLAISEFEARRAGPSYTIDTLNHFAAAYPGRNRLHFIIGIDAFLEINTWKSYMRLFDLAAFVVMARPGIAASPADALSRAADFTRHCISEVYDLDHPGRRLIHPDKQSIHLASVSQVDIASTQIRARIHQGESIGDWVHPDVANYIETKGLYR